MCCCQNFVKGVFVFAATLLLSVVALASWLASRDQREALMLFFVHPLREYDASRNECDTTTSSSSWSVCTIWI